MIINKENLLSQASDQVLHDFIDAFPAGAHLKDVQTKKYLYSNQNFYGVDDAQKIIGLTVKDLDGFMRPWWGVGFAQKVDQFDDQVINASQSLVDNKRILLNQLGLIHIQDMKKIPVTSAHHKDKTLAILTMTFDLTENFSKFDLLCLYQKVYDNKRQSNLYFMKHFKIDDFFIDTLSEKEIICLLHMIEDKSHKYIAEKMQISIRTAESHINHINLKLRNNTLSFLVNFLKNRQKSSHDFVQNK